MKRLQERLREKQWHSVVNRHGAVVFIDKWGVPPLANEAADAIDELVEALSKITNAAVMSNDCLKMKEEIERSLTLLAKCKAGEK